MTARQNAVLPIATAALAPDGLRQQMHHVAVGNRKIFESIIESPIGDGASVIMDSCDATGCAVSSDQTQLHVCATFGKADALARWLTPLRQKINEKNKNGQTALHLACRHGHVRCVELLMQADAALDEKDLSGSTALHLALKYQKLDVAKILLKKVNSSIPLLEKIDIKNRTPLHEAVLTGSVELCRLLVQSGAPLNASDTFGRTPIMLACSAGLTDIVTCLFEEYTACHLVASNIPHPASMQDSEGATIIHYAVLRNNLPLLRKVVKYAYQWLNTEKQKCKSTALHLAASLGYKETVEVLTDYGAALDPVDAEGETPLHRACHFNRLDCLDLLIRKGADVEIRDHSGKSVWHRAAAAGHHEVLTLLLSKGNKNQVKTLMYDAQSYTPLHYACINDRQKCTEVLLNWASAMGEETLSFMLKAEAPSGCTAVHFAASRPESFNILLILLQHASNSVTWTDGEMKTPLHLAAEHDCVQNIELLLVYQADTSVVDIEGRTALHTACARGCVSSATVLLSNGSDYNQRDWNGRQPLTLASEGSHCTVVKLLLEAGCNVNAIDDSGCTALHVACAVDSAEVVTMLIDGGCDLRARNKNGNTALHTSIARRCKNAAAAIVEHNNWEIAMDSLDENGVTVMSKLIKDLPSVAKIVLDRCCLTLPSSNQADAEVEKKCIFKYIDVPVHGDGSWPVQEMISNNRMYLITHQLVQSWVENKWQVHGQRYMMMQIFMILIHQICLIMHTIYLVEYEESDNLNFTLKANMTNLSMEEQCQTMQCKPSGNQLTPFKVNFWQVTLLITSSIFTINLFLSVKCGRFAFATDFPQDICTAIMIVATFVFVLPLGYAWQRQSCSFANLATVFSLLLVTRWVEFIGMISGGISSIVLLLILFFFTVAIPFMIIYCLVFMLLLYDKDEFASLQSSLASVMNMAMGEINFSSVFLENKNPYKWNAIMVEVLFIFTFNIILLSFSTAIALNNLDQVMAKVECTTIYYKIAWLKKCQIYPVIDKKKYYIKEKIEKGSTVSNSIILAARWLARQEREEVDYAP